MYDPFNHVHEIELYWLQSFFLQHHCYLNMILTPPLFLSLLCSTLLLSLSLSPLSRAAHFVLECCFRAWLVMGYRTTSDPMQQC